MVIIYFSQIIGITNKSVHGKKKKMTISKRSFLKVMAHILQCKIRHSELETK